ncbi:MAG: hypothetical protein WA908_00595 [Pontixanthobacter sp.]
MTYLLILPPILPSNHPDPIEHEKRWLAHVRAGRIGSNPGTSRALLRRHINNELVLLGERS